MDRRRFLAATGATAFLALAGCTDDGAGGTTTVTSPGNGTSPDSSTTPGTSTTTEPPEAGLTNGSFEAGLEGWQVGTDLPTDPNTGDPVATDSTVERGGTGGRPQASDGERVLALFIDGLQDDGTIWVQQQVDLRPFDTLAVDVHSEMESANTVTKVAAYAGALPDTPLVETAFDTTRPADAHEGWGTFEYDTSPEPHGLVAVGISVVWETEVTKFLDDVRLL